MKKETLLKILAISLVLVFAISGNAFAASVAMWTNDYSGWDTHSFYTDVSTYMTQAGYSTKSEKYKRTASQILSDMESSYNLFEWTGHSAPGELVTSDGNFWNLYAKGSPGYDIKDDLEFGATTGKTFWLTGCESAETDSTYGCLPDEILAKASSSCRVYAVDIAYAQTTARNWNKYTWQYMASGSSLSNAIYPAANDAGVSDIYGFDSSNVWYYQR